MPKKMFIFERLWFAVEYNSKWVRPLSVPMHVGFLTGPSGIHDYKIRYTSTVLYGVLG